MVQLKELYSRNGVPCSIPVIKILREPYAIVQPSDGPTWRHGRVVDIEVLYDFIKNRP